ncbi:MAG: RluA family pseudouridine synthase [Bacilli bacterium]
MEKLKVINGGTRLDNYLSLELGKTRSQISSNIKCNNITVNGLPTKAGYIVKTDDLIEVVRSENETEAREENIKLDIVYEDEYLMVINKPSGMVVHPGSGNYSHTLVNALMYYTKDLSTIGGEFRPGIVHRIDKDTSGLLLVSKTNEVHEKLAACFKNKTIKRKYIALVSGIIEENSGTIDAPIGRNTQNRKKMCVTDINSKHAVTNFTVLERLNNASLVECVLETGRTHQIRVHMSYILHPLINDPVYGKKIINDYGQMLHAQYLGFVHPITNKFLEFSVKPEKEFEDILNTFRD